MQVKTLSITTDGMGSPVSYQTFNLPTGITNFSIVLSGNGTGAQFNNCGQQLSLSAANQNNTVQVTGTTGSWSNVLGTTTLLMGWTGTLAAGDYFTVTLEAMSGIYYVSTFNVTAIVTYW
jgi:hypothetical protein